MEIAGIKIYKSMNIPFFSKYGTKYGTGTTPATTDPGNTGSFVGELRKMLLTMTGINNEYGEETEFANSCGLIFQREAAGVVEAIGPSSASHFGRRLRGLPGRRDFGSPRYGRGLPEPCCCSGTVCWVLPSLPHSDSFSRDPSGSLFLSNSDMPFPTYAVSTELDAVNQILSSVGQAPVTTLDLQNPEVAIVLNTLREVNKQVQSEGWIFNTERDYTLDP